MKIGETFNIKLEDALAPKVGQLFRITLQDEPEVNARLMSVAENHAQFKVVPDDMKD